jgi:hypothetical protein
MLISIGKFWSPMIFDELKCALGSRNCHILRELSEFINELLLVVNDISNQKFFNNFKLPDTQDVDLIERAYDNLLPFAVESENGRHDIYCYDFEQEAHPKVVAFSGHAIVKRWDSPRAFINWLRRIAKEKR